MNNKAESLYANFNEEIKELAKGRVKSKIHCKVHQELSQKFNNKESEKEIDGLIESGMLQITDYSEFLEGLENFFTVTPYPNITSCKNIEDYIMNYIFTLETKSFVGIEKLSMTQLFITLSMFAEKLEEKEIVFAPLEYYFKLLALSTMHMANRTQFEVHILDRKIIAEFSERLNFKPSTYYSICNEYLKALVDVSRSLNAITRTKTPILYYVHGVYSNGIKTLIKKVSEKFDIPFNKVEEELSCISFDTDNSELKAIVTRFCQNNDIQTPVAEVFEEVQKLYIKGYSLEVDEPEREIIQNIIPIIPKYVYLDFYKEKLFTSSASITIDFLKVSTDSIEVLLNYAAMILDVLKPGTDTKIILENTPLVSTKFLRRLNNLLVLLQNIYSTSLSFEIYFDPEVKESIVQNNINEVYILSDIHCDYNKGNLPPLYTKQKFIINCGDTSGSVEDTINWVKSNIDLGVFTHGNHLGYSDRTPLQDQIQALKEAFPLNADVSYLNNAYKECNGIVYIGACLYTDFTLYGKENVNYYKRQAEYGMNDFRRPRIKEGNLIRFLTPADYVKWHNESVQYIYETTEKFKDKPIIILTHFAPLPFSIHSKYGKDPLNAAFANDLRDLFEARPYIRAWVHGHCHDSFNYLYNKTRVICSPYGYYHEREKGKGVYPTMNMSIENIISNKNPNNIKKFVYKNWNPED